MESGATRAEPPAEHRIHAHRKGSGGTGSRTFVPDGFKWK